MSFPRVLRHLVLCTFKDETTTSQLEKIIDGFAQLKQEIHQVHSFEYGTNNSPEGLNQGFTHCFNLGFMDEAARDVYLAHPSHLAFVELLKPSLANVLVLDYWPSSS